ncbi:MAG: hypothetical protein K8F25_09250 [Fimbriimonadaceae bacterium]|nr:hypothetical protein [Alphaproteobacteria bacterium]
MDQKDCVVGVIDVGSPRTGKLGWAIRYGDEQSHGSDLDDFIARFAVSCDGRPAALGFEAPLFVPLRDEALSLTSARKGEGSRSWSASAGANVLAIAIPIVTYTLMKLRPVMKNRTATLDWQNWSGIVPDELLVFEAFVSGGSKGSDHWHDADIACEAFVEVLLDLAGANAIDEADVVSLVGAGLIRSGWCLPSSDLLKQSALVIKP